MKRRRRASWFFWFALAGGVCAIAAMMADIVLIGRLSGPVFALGWQMSDGLVTHVDPTGPARELRPGDRVIAINRDTRVQVTGAWVKLGFEPLHESYLLTVERGGALLDFTIAPAWTPPVSHWPQVAALSFVGFSFVAMAMLLGLAKPDDTLTRIGWLAGITIAMEPLTFEILAVMPNARGAARHFLAATTWPFNPIHMALGYDFLARFPAGTVPPGLWRQLRRGFYFYAIAHWMLSSFVRLTGAETYDLAYAVQRRLPDLLAAWINSDAVWVMIYGATGLAMLAVTLRNYRSLRDVGHRRRLRWALYAVLAVLTPPALFSAIAPFSAALRSEPLIGRVETGFNWMLAIVPWTLTYVVLRHRVLDLNVVVRRGLQYLLARNVLRAILLIPVADLVWTAASNPNLPVGQVLFRHSPVFYGFTIAAAVLLRYRKQASGWLDRRFFREAYSQEKILLELMERIKQVDAVREIAPLVSSQIEAALHPSTVFVFYREDEVSGLTLGHASTSSTAETRLRADRPILRVLAERSRALDVRDCPSEEREWLEQMSAELVVPVGASSKLAGLLILGEKMSEEPYTGTDRNLLQAIAGQIAVVYENHWLKERVDRDHQVRMEVLAQLGDRRIALLKECAVCGLCADGDAERCTMGGAERA